MSRLRLSVRNCCMRCSRQPCWLHWRDWCKPLLLVLYLIVLLVLLPVLIYELYAEGAGDQFKAWFVAGIFVLLTLPIFFIGIMQHMFNYTKPYLQKHIIRILWIVPIYSIESWLALLFPATAIYWDSIRECYEAYVLYNFLCYLLNYLESEYDLSPELEALYPIYHPIPCCCCPPWPKGRRFVFWCKFGTLQYTVMRLIITLTALITQWCGVYKKGKIRFDKAWIYLAIFNAISQMIAIHSLIYFYKGTRKLLGPIKPVWKFLTIKAIVFAIFWQAVLIALLVKFEALPSKWEKYDVEDVTEGLQNFIICVEMFLFALAHYFVFSHKPFVDPAAARAPCIASCLRMLDIRDVADDVKEHFVDPIPRPKLPTITRRTRSNNTDEETTPLVAEESPNINCDTERTQRRPVFRTNVDISSDFGILSYRDLNPQPSPEQRSVPSTSSSSSSRNSDTNSSDNTQQTSDRNNE